MRKERKYFFMKKVNTVKIINEFSKYGKINPHYCLRICDANAIKNIDMGVYDLINNAFVFGYAQGCNATLAEMKKRSVV